MIELLFESQTWFSVALNYLMWYALMTMFWMITCMHVS